MKVPSENSLLCVTKTWGGGTPEIIKNNNNNNKALVLKNSELLQKIIYEITNPQFMKIHDFLITIKLTSKICHVWSNCHI